jgi:UTP:GlnB (protein PII) uridylyltransferase
VWNGVDDVPLLVLGTLLHDVGKMQAGTDHAVSGEKIARKIGTRLGLDGERTGGLACSCAAICCCRALPGFAT